MQYIIAIFIAIICLLLQCDNLVYANDFDITKNFQSQIVYYDAHTIKGNKNRGEIILEEKAVLLFDNFFLEADSIIFNKEIGLITAVGNVNVLYGQQKASCSHAVFDINAKQMRLDDVSIISDPDFSTEKLTKEIYNFSQAEIAFESNKEQRSQEIKKDLIKLREDYVNLKNRQSIYRDALSREKIQQEIKKTELNYAKLLARYTRTVNQPNLIFSEFPEDIQEKIKQRRVALSNFNIQNPTLGGKFNNFAIGNSYLSIHASRAYFLNNEYYKLENAIITSCKCTLSNEPAAWSFSTKYAEIEVGDYITMAGSTVDILEIPVFYTPFVKLPIKNKRESGFLLPSGYTSNSGQEFSIPYFITLGDSADTTLTLDYFSKRGLRFDTEMRLKFTQDSQLTLAGEIARDNFYRTDWRNKFLLAQQTTASNSYSLQEQQQITNLVGKDRLNRWHLLEDLNVPLGPDFALKTNGEFISDNRYFYDFSPIINDTLDLFIIQSANKRFINQALSAEYYGENISLSARLQQTRDLFTFDNNATPKRMPLLEFYLLPKRYFSLPFSFDNKTTWENIASSKDFSSVAQNQLQGFTQKQFGTLPNKTFSDNNKEFYFDVPHILNPSQDPYLKGQRFFSASSVTLPLKANRYINAYLQGTGNFVTYFFPKAESIPLDRPIQAYAKYEAYIDLPLYAKTDYFDSKGNNLGDIKNLMVPYVKLSSLPKVVTTENFPKSNQLFYTADDISAKQLLSFGFRSDWTITRRQFQQNKQSISRTSDDKNMPVGNLDKFLSDAKTLPLEIPKDLSAQTIYEHSAEDSFHTLFEKWAKDELEKYEKFIEEKEFAQHNIWDAESPYSETILWQSKPFGFSVESSYNFIAQRTADELNARAGPEVAPFIPEYLGDTIASFYWDSAPLLPLSGTFTTTYSHSYKRINGMNVTARLSLPPKFNLTYGNSFAVIQDPSKVNNFLQRRTISGDLSYQALDWLKFRVQYQQLTDSSATPPPQGGPAYAALQSIAITNIQNCLDLVFTRVKQAGFYEYQATYMIGINLKILGQNQGIDQIANSLDSAIKAKAAK